MFRLPTIAALILLAGPAFAAAPGEDPDWPCVQRKVPTLTPAAIWAGPPIDDVAGRWRDVPAIADLVPRLAARRMPMPEAQAEIEAFAQAQGEEERREALRLLFAGLFDVMDRERSEIMEGIQRYARRQRALADAVRTEVAAVDALRNAPQPDATAVMKAEERLLWNTRIFDERRSALTYICEVPRTVEQRLYALGQAIAALMPE